MSLFSTVRTRMNDGVRAEIDMPMLVEADLMTMVTDDNISHPRSNMPSNHIGPSEAAHPCTRRLIHKLSGHTEVRRSGGGSFLAQLGRWNHAGMDNAVAKHPNCDRYLREHPVTVGQVQGRDIFGNLDLFDIDAGTVIDHKFVGDTRLERYRLYGPGPQYKGQIHLYGRGLVAQGYDVHQVMIAFFPRNAEAGTGVLLPGGQGFVDPGKRYFWSEPYDESVALGVLARLNGLAELLSVIGTKALLEMYPECGEWYCPWCPGETK